MSLNGKMGRKHEDDLVDLLGGYRTVASGSTWRDQMDGRLNRDRVPFAFAWDGKSTLGKSVGVSRAMWEKAVTQACGERPMLALRFYDTERLDVGLDLAVLNLHDFAEMLEKVNRAEEPVTKSVYQSMTRLFYTRANPEAGVEANVVIVKPDGMVDRVKDLKVVRRLGGPTEVCIDDRQLTEADGPLEVYVDGTVVFRGWSGTLWVVGDDE